MRKTLLAFLLTITLMLGINVESVYAGNADTLVVHYHRYDEDYNPWFLHIWKADTTGIDHTFSSSDTYGVTATIDITANYGDVDEVGLLVRDASWNKDWGNDRFIDLSNPNNEGETHIYLLQGEEFISYVEEDQTGCNHSNPSPTLCAQEISVGLIDVFVNDDYKIEFLSTDTVNASDITVYEDGVSVPFSGFTSGKTGELTVANLDVSKAYTVDFTYGTEVVDSIVRVGADFDSQIFADAYHYDGFLGHIYTQTATTVRVWAPVSSQVSLNLYTAGHPTSVRADGVNTPYEVHEMTYIGQGVWEQVLTGDMHGVYYTFTVVNSGETVSDIQDPYGKTFGLNGARSMIIDMDRVNPEGWDADKGIDGYTNANDSIIYEIHVRDLTSSSTWGGSSEYKNTYLGFTERGTTYTNSMTGVTVSTGLDHLIELGITHVHLLPTYDQDWNDERNFQFNWGYNPQNYNAPEGGYSTDPFDGSTRVNEYKQMVMALHENGINVIQDVVYNHTGPGDYYSFNRIVPGYFYRYNSNGDHQNGSGCGNTTASDRYMVNKFIVDSTEYWATEYHIDGFRFDLMAIHDYKTMDDLSRNLETIDHDIFVYGEPWSASPGEIGIPYDEQAGKNNLWRMPYVAAFNDDFRNAIKGSPDGDDAGYVTTGYNTSGIKTGIRGSDYGNDTTQSVNYVTAHDNLTLWDKLARANGSSYSQYSRLIDYQARLSNSIVLFSQGTPFLHAGVDFIRSKDGNHNSYDASDAINQLDYSRKSMYVNSFEYYKGIIDIRQEFDSFKMTDRTEISNELQFLSPDGYGMIGYRLTRGTEDILIYFHGGDATDIDVELPSGSWELIVDRDQAGLDKDMGTYANTYPIEPYETLVFIKGNSNDVIASPEHEEFLPDNPVITNEDNTITEGDVFTLTTDRDVVAYSINGDFIDVNNLDSIDIDGLTEGRYVIVVRASDGTLSKSFLLFVEAVPEETCEENPDQDKCTIIEPEETCEENPNQDKCTTIEPEPEPEDNTGCFGSTSSGILSLISIAGLAVASLTILVIKRK